MGYLFVIKIQQSGLIRYIVNGNNGTPPSSININDATVFCTELQAVKKAYRLGLMYPNIEFTVTKKEI